MSASATQVKRAPWRAKKRRWGCGIVASVVSSSKLRKRPFRNGDRVRIAEGPGVVLHPWPRNESTGYYAIRLDSERLRIVRPDEITSAKEG